MSRALAFMADPDLAASVLPAPGTGFDIPAFLRDAGTVYMIAEAVSEDAPVAPLFAAMASEIHWIAAQMGQASPSGRLDPPLLMGLDEVTQICPVPLPSWLSDSGGKGIQVVAVVHGEAQLAERWGEHGRQVVLDTSSVKVFLPGITDVTTLQAASTLCGQASWKVRGQDHATRHDVATPDMIRQLPAGFALVIRGGCAPVIARLPRAWRNPAYRRARRQAPGPGRARPGQRPVHPRSRARRADPRRRHRPALEPDMTDDQITAALDQLAAQREQITRLDTREATHYATLTGLLAGLTARTGPDPARTTPAATSPTRPRAWWQLSPEDRQQPVARLRAWVDQVYRPGYGHLAAALGPCWPAHDLCLYALDIASGLWSVLYLQPGRDHALLSAQAEYQARILPALAAQLTDRNHPLRPHPPPEHAMTDDPTLRQALAYARRGWPVFPCQPGQKIPATRHGYRDATTDPSSRSPTGSPATPAATWPSPPALPAPTSWTSTSTARPGTGTPPSAGSTAPGCSTARTATSAPPAAACTSTSPAPPSTAATWPRTTWTSAPPAATSWPRPPRSTATPTSRGEPPAATAP